MWPSGAGSSLTYEPSAKPTRRPWASSKSTSTGQLTSAVIPGAGSASPSARLPSRATSASGPPKRAVQAPGSQLTGERVAAASNTRPCSEALPVASRSG